MKSKKGEAYAIVEKGDTLSNIVKDIAPDENWQDVAKFNNMKNPNLIKPDQKIKMPNSIVPNIEADLMSKMRKNAKDFWINSPFYFRNKIRNRGDWDFKNQKGSIYESGKYKYYLFKDKIIPSDAPPGNIHYGYVGKAAIWSWEKLLLKKAGEAQIKAGTSLRQWQNDRYYGDDPIDQFYIKMGFELYGKDN